MNGSGPKLVGFAFPFRFAATGGIKQSRDFDKIAENLRHLLSTRLGERVMLRSTYGGGVHFRLQEPNDATLRTLIKHEIEQALRRYMPEVRLTAPVRVSAREAELLVVVEYQADPREAARRLELAIPGRGGL